MKFNIKSKQAYHETMVGIYNLMNKGEANLSSTEIRKLTAMVDAAEKYEDQVLGLQPKKVPQSIPEIVELKMVENRMTQSKLARELGVGKSKVSEILSGKRKPDLVFVKGVYKILKVDATFLLDHV